MRIGAKILAILTLSWVVGAAAMITSGVRMFNVLDQYSMLLSNEAHQAEEAVRLQVAFKKEVQEWKDLLLRGADPVLFAKHSAGFEREQQRVRTAAESLRLQLMDPESLAAITSFIAAHETLAAAYDEARHVFAQDSAHDSTVPDRSVRGRDRPVTDMLDIIQTRLEQRLTMRIAEEHDKARRAEVITFAIWLPLAAATVFLSLRLIRAIRLPLGEMTQAAESVSNGNLNQVIAYRSTDELGLLGESLRGSIQYIQDAATATKALRDGDLTFSLEPKSPGDALSRNLIGAKDSLTALLNEVDVLLSAAHEGRLDARGDASKFCGAYASLVQRINQVLEATQTPIRETSSALDKLAAGDLTVRITGAYRGEFGVMRVTFNSAVETLAQGLLQVASTSQEVSTAAAQIASISQLVAQGSTEQASFIAKMNDSLRSLSASTSESASKARAANELVVATTHSSTESATVMNEMIQAVRGIREAAERTAAIIRDINEIAFQTNILSLNAAVEAARAGEAGRGFAVVAQEVRELAMRSKEAARKTEMLIGGSVEQASRGASLCTDVERRLAEVTTSLRQVEALATGIAHAADEQAREVGRVTEAAIAVDGVTQQNASTAEESASSSEELSGQARELHSLLDRFRLRKRVSYAPDAPTARALNGGVH